MWAPSPAGLVETSRAGAPRPPPPGGAGDTCCSGWDLSEFPSYFGHRGLLVSPGQLHWGEGVGPREPGGAGLRPAGVGTAHRQRQQQSTTETSRRSIFHLTVLPSRECGSIIVNPAALGETEAPNHQPQLQEPGPESGLLPGRCPLQLHGHRPLLDPDRRVPGPGSPHAPVALFSPLRGPCLLQETTLSG